MTAIASRSSSALAHYDPRKGVKRIDFLAMAEKHYARAKDATKLLQAIRAKLEAQAEFVQWWDAQGPGTNHGGRRQKGNISDRKSWSDNLPNEVMVCRWRRALSTPEAFEHTFEDRCARYIRILEFDTVAHVGQNTGETEWFTPAEVVEPARRVLGGIDLDPASTPEANSVIKAARFYTRRDDGLTKPWLGRVWMNPPYAYPLIEQFAEKFAASISDGSVTAAIALVNNATETEWFHTIAGVCSAVCFLKSRVRFWHPNKLTAAPLQGQALLYAGGDVAAFTREYTPLGTVLGHVWVKP